MSRSEQKADELAQFLEALETSFEGMDDRSVAVTGAAGLDFVLEQLLRATLIEQMPNGVFVDANGALGTFSSKIAIAYAIGAISTDEYRELNVVRRIRNDLAHSVAKGTFVHVAQRCTGLQLGRCMYLPDVPLDNLQAWQDCDDEEERDRLLPEVGPMKPATTDPRMHFVLAVVSLGHMISRLRGNSTQVPAGI